MKNFLFTLVSLLFISSVANAQRSTITKFHGEELAGLIVSGAFDINISYGSDTKVEVNFPDDMIGKMSVELTDDKYVRLGFGSGFENFFVAQKNRPKATIVLEKLSYLNISGSAMLIGSGISQSDKFVMTVSGSAFASFVMVDCQEAVCDVAGSAKIEDVRIVANRKVQVNVGGSAKVSIGGRSAALKVVTSGASLVDLLSFDSPTIEAVTSGTSLVKASVEGKAEVISSGMSAFRYVGSGLVTGNGAQRM